MSDIINLELIQIANSDIHIINSIKSLVINHLIIKKIHHLMWHILHSFSILYPDTPSEEQKLQLKLFILDFKPKLHLFCASCQKTKDTFIENSDIDMAISSKDNLIQFFCDYHIEVNTKYKQNNTLYNSSLYNRQNILNKYMLNDYLDLIEKKYNINLFKLFEANDLNSFFGRFNEIKKLIHTEKFDFNINFYEL